MARLRNDDVRMGEDALAYNLPNFSQASFSRLSQDDDTLPSVPTISADTPSSPTYNTYSLAQIDSWVDNSGQNVGSDGTIYTNTDVDISGPNYSSVSSSGTSLQRIIVTEFDQTTLQGYANDGWSFYAVYTDGTEDFVSYTEVFDPSLSIAQTVVDRGDAIASAINQHFWYDTNGIHVTEDEQDDWLTYVSNNFSGSSTLNSNILINSLGVLIRSKLNNLASISTDSIAFYDGLGNNTNNVMAYFGSSGVRIGANNKNRVDITPSELSMTDSASNKYFSVLNLLDNNGRFYITDLFTEIPSTYKFTLSYVRLNSSSGYYVTSVKINDTEIASSDYSLVYTSSAPYVQITNHVISDGDVISITYYLTESQAARAYTLGLRKSELSLGIGSFSVGYDNEASGTFSTAFGRSTTAKQSYSSAFGYGSVANGLSAFAFGVSSNAIGLTSIAGGYSATASDHSVALGYRSNANMQTGVAIGTQVTAIAKGSTSLGMRNISDYSFGGFHHKTLTNGLLSFDEFTSTPNYALVVGGGYRYATGGTMTSPAWIATSPSNILELDWNGNLFVGKTDQYGRMQADGYGKVNGKDVSKALLTTGDTMTGILNFANTVYAYAPDADFGNSYLGNVYFELGKMSTTVSVAKTLSVKTGASVRENKNNTDLTDLPSNFTSRTVEGVWSNLDSSASVTYYMNADIGMYMFDGTKNFTVKQCVATPNGEHPYTIYTKTLNKSVVLDSTKVAIDSYLRGGSASNPYQFTVKIRISDIQSGATITYADTDPGWSWSFDFYYFPYEVKKYLKNGSSTTIPYHLTFGPTSSAYRGTPGLFSASFGTGLKATGDNQLVIGKYNVADTNAAFIVGNGTNVSTSYQKTTFSVSKEGAVTASSSMTATSFVNSSDRRLKENLVPLGDEAVDFINSLTTYQYDIGKGDDSRHEVGVIAQDVYDHDPWHSSMAYETNNIDALNNVEKSAGISSVWRLEYNRLIPPIIATVQSQAKRIEKLEKIIESLSK